MMTSRTTDKPGRISGPQWWFVMVTVIIGFLALVLPLPLFPNRFGQFIPAILFFAIPLVGLAIVTPHYWTAIFRPIRGRDVKWIIGFAVLNILVSMAVGAVILRLLGATTNPSVSGLGKLSTSERVLFFLKTAPQLFGEEVLTILPFLGVMYFLFARMKLSRKTSIVSSWLSSALLFGLAHLPTYDWNFIQCVIVIGSARLVLTLPYIMTKNLWVSTGAHIVNDWTIFALTILGADLSSSATSISTTIVSV